MHPACPPGSTSIAGESCTRKLLSFVHDADKSVLLRTLAAAMTPSPLNTACPAGTYAKDGICLTCPAGATSDEGSTECRCKDGYATSGSGASLTCTSTLMQRVKARAAPQQANSVQRTFSSVRANRKVCTAGTFAPAGARQCTRKALRCDRQDLISIVLTRTSVSADA